MNTVTQRQQVLEHLKQFGSITSWDAIRLYRATRLSGIIYSLRKSGHNIVSVTETNGDKRYARYVLKPSA